MQRVSFKGTKVLLNLTHLPLTKLTLYSLLLWRVLYQKKYKQISKSSNTLVPLKTPCILYISIEIITLVPAAAILEAIRLLNNFLCKI